MENCCVPRLLRRYTFSPLQAMVADLWEPPCGPATRCLGCRADRLWNTPIGGNPMNPVLLRNTWTRKASPMIVWRIQTDWWIKQLTLFKVVRWLGGIRDVPNLGRGRLETAVYWRIPGKQKCRKL